MMAQERFKRLKNKLFMKNKYKTRINFVIDPVLINEDRTDFLIRALQDEKIKYSSDFKEFNDLSLIVIFTSKSSLRVYSKYKNKILVMDSNEDLEGAVIDKINLNSHDEIRSYIEKIKLVESRLVFQAKIKESEQVYEKIKALNFKKKAETFLELGDDQKKDLDSLLELEIELLRLENIQEWNLQFKIFTKKHVLLQYLAFYNASDLVGNDIILDDFTFVFSFPIKDFYLVLKFKSANYIEESVFFEMLMTMIMRTIQIQDQQLINTDGEIDFWKKIFSKIPYPMAVISSLGDLLIYNESFAKIGILPKECLRFKDHESLEIFQQFYKVRRIEFSIALLNVSYFVFYTSEAKELEDVSLSPSVFGEKYVSSKNVEKSSMDELGIISSSIAHELNNPLAGILAALSLLSLEEGWSEDNLIDLADMKNGAKRCKELVEIFLGFSKFEPVIGETPSIHGSLDQALNLLRFRMIESNLRLDMRYVATLELFSHQVNSSIMSMIFYLILSELMTAFAHERLITQSNISAMCGEVLEFNNQIMMKLDHDFEYEDKLAQSKLIQHLLVFEKFDINFLRKEIRLIYRA